MIGEDVIKEARRAASALEEDYGECPASQLLEQMADACEAENARRKLLAEAAGLEAEPSDSAAAALDKLRLTAADDSSFALGNQMWRDECRLIANHIDRQQKRIEALEALLSDAEDTLRARAEGRRAGLLEASDVCQDRLDDCREAYVGGFLLGLRDTFRSMALPSAGQSGQEG